MVWAGPYRVSRGFKRVHFRFRWALQGFTCPRLGLSWALQGFAWFLEGPFSLSLGPTGFCVPQTWFELGPTRFHVVVQAWFLLVPAVFCDGSSLVLVGHYRASRAPDLV